MLQKLFKQYFFLKGGKPGRRFRDFFRHRQMQRGYRLTPDKIATIGGGLLLSAAGLFLMPVPGPGGTATFLLGLALLGSEFEPVAHGLDWLEEKLQPTFESARKFWSRISPVAQLSMKYGFVVACAVLSFVAYRALMM